MAKIPKIKLGNQTAINGGKSDCSAITPKILSKKTKTMAIQIPTARLIPIPPRLLIDDTATAMIVKIKNRNGQTPFSIQTQFETSHIR